VLFSSASINRSTAGRRTPSWCGTDVEARNQAGSSQRTTREPRYRLRAHQSTNASAQLQLADSEPASRSSLPAAGFFCQPPIHNLIDHSYRGSQYSSENNYRRRSLTQDRTMHLQARCGTMQY
jgi:hypothetical protein